MEYNKNNKLRLFEICAGYGSQALALRRLREIYHEFDYELVGWAEYDPEDLINQNDPESHRPIDEQPAVIAHNALHPEGTGKNWGDITKITWEDLPDFDLLTYSTPCQSVSQAGLQHGFTEGSGTRSSIIWNVRDCVKAKRPKFLMLENVKAMVSGKFIGLFNLWQNELGRLGYANFAKVLNAKDFGVPQNRERIFLISIRIDNESDIPSYYFPNTRPLELCLEDVLETNVEEKYFLSDEMLARFCEKAWKRITFRENRKAQAPMKKMKTLTLRTSLLFSRIKPQNVCSGGVACTINTRYEKAAIKDYTTLKHFPKTAVCYVYETC